MKLAQLRLSKEQVADDVRLQFAPKDAGQFFKSYGWQLTEERSLWQEAHRLKRDVIFGKLLRHFPIFNLSVISLEKATDQTPIAPVQRVQP